MTKISNQYSLTNILTADLANSRLGINNVSPTVALDVTGAGKFSSSVLATSYNATTQNIFSVDGSEKMRITSAGNVGIGLTSILAKLHVENTSSADPTSLSSIPTTNIFGMSTSPGGMLAAGIGTTGGTHVWLQGRNVGGAGVSYPIVFQPLGGNVGIGTSTPFNTNGYTSFTINGTTGSIIEMLANGTRSMQIVAASDISYFYGALNTPMAWYTNATERMRITSGGNLLVGTTSDNGNKLQVSGGISASGNISGANIGGSSFSMNFGNAFNYGTGYLKSSTNGITVTTSTTTIFTSTNIGGVNSGNLVLVSGVRSGNGPTFTDLILYMNSGSISVISSQIFSTPPSRNYSVSNENLNLSMASGTYIVSLVALNQGYTNT